MNPSTSASSAKSIKEVDQTSALAAYSNVTLNEKRVLNENLRLGERHFENSNFKTAILYFEAAEELSELLDTKNQPKIKERLAEAEYRLAREFFHGRENRDGRDNWDEAMNLCKKAVQKGHTEAAELKVTILNLRQPNKTFKAQENYQREQKKDDKTTKEKIKEIKRKITHLLKTHHQVKQTNRSREPEQAASSARMQAPPPPYSPVANNAVISEPQPYSPISNNVAIAELQSYSHTRDNAVIDEPPPRYPGPG